MSDDEALEELKHCGGAQFDPIVVEAFAAELTRLRAAQQQHAEERSRASPSLMA
jgi:response regulator RpfG family c-di-GMP phosphodiesterase